MQVQVMVVKGSEDGSVESAARALHEELTAAGVRVRLDDRVDTPFGRRAVDAELKGIPFRIEVGPRDLAEGRVTLARRVLATKEPHALSAVTAAVLTAIDADHAELYRQAEQRLVDRTSEVSTVEDAIAATAEGWARLPWRLLGDEGEARIAGQGVTVRCLVRADGSVPDSDDPELEPDLIAVLARAY